MKVAGQAVLHAPIDRVWAALNDPAVLARTIPGCEQLETTGPDAFAMTVTAGVASIKGTYAGTVALSDQQHPTSFVMRASGAGGPGTVSADVTVRLTDEGAMTRLAYDAEAIVGGVIGGVGQRMLTAVAKKLAGEFFAGVDDVLTGRVAPALGAQPIAAAAGGEPSPVSTVFAGTAAPSRPSEGAERGFVRGVVVGAVIALAGVVVGAAVGARAAHRHD